MRAITKISESMILTSASSGGEGRLRAHELESKHEFASGVPYQVA
jgi:hypothetical protein